MTVEEFYSVSFIIDRTVYSTGIIYESNLILLTLRVYTNEIDKISYRTLYEKTYSGYPVDVRPGQYFWVLKLQCTELWDNLEAYKFNPVAQGVAVVNFVLIKLIFQFIL